MVNFWDEEIKIAIANKKRRIKIMEKSGNGKEVIALKNELQKVLRTQELRK